MTSSSDSLTLEIPNDLASALRSEYERLSAEANPRLMSWSAFVGACMLIGLDKLSEMSIEDVALRLEKLEQIEDRRPTLVTRLLVGKLVMPLLSFARVREFMTNDHGRIVWLNGERQD